MADLQELELDIRGMHCDTCVTHVQRALEGVAGVREVRVPGWRSADATVLVAEGSDASALIGAVEAAGYSASIRSRRPLGGPNARERRGNGSIDLMVVGGGSAGFAAAIRGAELGFDVALVEAGTIGGTCVNVGCIPSKTLLRAVEHYNLAGLDRFRGVRTRQEGLAWPDVIEHKDELVAEMRQARYLDVLDGYPNIHLVDGRAELKGGTRIEIDGRVYTPDKIVLATGARPWTPPIPGLKEAGYLDSEAALDLKELPESMIVLGGSAVGLEMAQLYARAGAQVTVLEHLPRVAPFEDETISEAITGYLMQEGLQIHTGFEARRVENRDGHYLIDGSEDGKSTTFEAGALLVAAGRRANTGGFGLEGAGVELGERGEVLVDEHLRTSNPAVYAAGDVLGRDMFVYLAGYGGALAAENALTAAGRVYDTSAVPRVTFTDPEIASVGLSEAQARAQGFDVKVSEIGLDIVARPQVARDRRGLIKLIVAAEDDRLLGAHVLAPEAGEVIQTAVLALSFRITAGQLRETLFPYLTNVEGLKLAALALEKDVALLSCCAG